MILRGLRVSEVANLKLEQIDWEQQALQVVQGKGRKDRRVYMSPDAVASVQQCLEQHPGERAQGYVFGIVNVHQHPLSVKAIQKKMERHAKAAGITASCHSLRHVCLKPAQNTGQRSWRFATSGHSQIASMSGMPNSNQRIKQEYMRTMQKIPEAGPGVTQERDTVYIIYTTKIIFVIYYSHKDHVRRDTT